MKTCSRCKVEKGLSEFYRNCQTADGRQGHCKSCQNEYIYARRASVVGRAESKVYGAVGAAIKSGELTRGPCEVCGTDDAVQAHHDDYDKPLDVRWFCHPHHAEYHRINGRRKFDKCW